MPRLSDLVSDKLKKQLFSGALKDAPGPHERDGRQAVERPAPAPGNDSAAPQFRLPDFAAIDVETTGLDFSADRVIEIGAVLFRNGRPDAEFSSFVNPGMPLPAAITELTGITDADVAAAPPFAAVATHLLSFIGDYPLCGHQIEFDLTFLSRELERAGLKPLERQFLDTVLLSKIVLHEGKRFSLKSVSSTLEVKLEDAHRALQDAKASGEVALALLPRLIDLPLQVRQTMAAAAPASLLKSLIVKSLGGAAPAVRVRSLCASPAGPKLAQPETFHDIDTGQVAAFFGREGGLSTAMPSFSPRPSQRDMACEVAAAFNTASILMAEAGTGTGKSLAYLLPAAFWALKNKTRVFVASRTRNLQDQLVSKELPLVASVLGSEFRSSVLKGRSNYLCLFRWERLLRGEGVNLSLRERYAILTLVPWADSTLSGDVEEQNQFNPKWFQKIWSLISAESHGCNGRHCKFFKACFLQLARAKALSSNIVVINHALFFSEICSGTSFLGKVDSIIFDEAHHLESEGHRHLRVQLDSNRISLFIEEMNNLVQHICNIKEINKIIDYGQTIKSHLKQVRKRSQAFLESVINTAKAKNRESNESGEYQISVQNADFSSNIEIPAFSNTLGILKDQLYDLKSRLSDSEALPKSKEIELLRQEAASCQEHTSQLSADLVYLTSASTEEHAFWVEGNFAKGWTKLCGVPLDIAGLLGSVWLECRGAVVFTSATLSIGRSIDYFFNSVGLEQHKQRTAVRLFPSPFSKEQALLGAVKTAPDPDSGGYAAYVAGIVRELHTVLGKNILVLFTSNAMLSSVYGLLRSFPDIGKERVLAQNISGGRHALLEEFKRGQHMILLGTDSFWEGIDAPGEACEVVVVPRLPFPVPTNPLTMAISERLARAGREPFVSYAVPEAVIRLRQGCGRLIRTGTDRGAFVVLDKRIVTKGYGQHFIRSLDAPFNAWSDAADMMRALQEFFSAAPEDRIVDGPRYVPLDEA